jgi:type IV pilus assembly protein PilW
LQENARFAFEFISSSARTAGYFGCGPEPRYTIKGLLGNWGQIPEFDIREAVSGVEGDNPNWAPVPTNVRVYLAGNEIDPGVIQANTDVLVFRSLREPVQRLADWLQPDGNPVITAPGGDPGIEVGDIILIANCEQGAMVRVTGRNIVGAEATLFHAVAGGSAFHNGANVVNLQDPLDVYPYSLSILGRVYGPDTTVGAVESTYYFIAPSTGLDNQGNTPPALWRKAGSAAPVELIQGVEDMQVRYGIDTTLGDGVNNANRFVDFDQVPDVNQIVALRVMLTTTSVDAVTDDGNQLRRSFTKTILIRNASPEV